MRNYYYFVATLPSVSYGDAPPKSSEDFREECLYHLAPGDAAVLTSCTYNAAAVTAAKPTGSAFIDALLARERTLLLNVAYLRAARLKRQISGEPPRDASDAEAVAKAAFEMGDPLEAELFLDRGRWDAIDALSGLDLFSVNMVYAYLMKLQLLERRQRFDAEKGFAGYKQLYDTILDEYNAGSGGGA
ncbi:MAG: DUF2764 domain-containing protein [Spirochaetaceae bacterium]|nr:DUF2764 domain-containing protein [Spirochaetaceae bacterium]